jgi:plastocyanin
MRACIISLVLLSLIVAAGPSFAAVTQVNVASFAFAPRAVTVSVGDTVKWVWQNGTHTATSGDTTACTGNGIFNGPLDVTHPTFSFRFTSAGDVPYFCVFHCSLMHMRGVVHVQTQSDVPDRIGPYEGSLLQVAPNPFQPGTVSSQPSPIGPSMPASSRSLGTAAT